MDTTDKTGHDTLDVISKADHFNYWIYETTRGYIDGNILEVGSGIGNISKYFVKDGAAITLSDVNPDYKKILEEQYGNEQNVAGILNIDLQHRQFDAEYAALKSKYDSIFLLNVLEHLNDDAAAIRNCHYMLKPGGKVVVLVPAYSFLYSKMDETLQHYKRYTTTSAAKVIAANNFYVIKKFYFNFLGIAAWWIGKIFQFRQIPAAQMNFFNKLIVAGKYLDKVVLHKAGLSAVVVARKTH